MQQELPVVKFTSLLRLNNTVYPKNERPGCTFAACKGKNCMKKLLHLDF